MGRIDGQRTPRCLTRAAALAALLLAAGPLHAQSSRDGGLGGGFIEFLFSGADDGAASPQAAPLQATPRLRRAPAYPGSTEVGYPVHPGLRASWPDRPAASSDPTDDRAAVPAAPHRTEVDYAGTERPGTIVVDTRTKVLLLVEPDGRALQYGVGVGRPGFEWKGRRQVERKAEWPDWRPPAEMIARKPDLPRFMAGGLGNPLGARALYLSGSLYRIHGSNEPWTIGHAVSSGCIRMRNEDVIDLYGRVKVGAPVVVL